MGFNTLSLAQAFNQGAELWIVPELTSSKTTQKLDWYLNFQLTKAQERQRSSIPAQIKFILESCQIDFTDSATEASDNLLIAANHLVPAKWVIQIPHQTDQKDWLKRIQKVWKSLEQPKLRVFLPNKMSSLDFQSEWKKIDSAQDVDLVAD